MSTDDHSPSTSSSANSLVKRRTENRETEKKEESNDDNTINSNETRTLSIFSLSGFIRILSVPIKYFCKNLIDLIKFTWSLIGFNQPQNTDPLVDVSNFVQNFKNKYGENHPQFYHGSYSNAVLEAKRDLKFLLVYLHNNLHEETEEFCKQVLTHLEVINYIKRNNLICWACSIDLKEGYLVSKIMRESTYPFLALVALKNNRMIIAKKFEGRTSVEKLLSQLQKAIEENEASMISSRLERQQRSMDQLIRKQQDQDYLDSLRADQEKERKKKEERERKEREEQEKRRKEQEEIDHKDRFMKLKQELVDHVIAEPNSKSPDVIKLLIKFPNGKKVERKFLKTNSIKSLFYFVFCHSDSPLKFTIKTSYPARELPCSTPTPETRCVQSTDNKNEEAPTFEQFGIKNCEVLYVHDLEA